MNEFNNSIYFVVRKQAAHLTPNQNTQRIDSTRTAMLPFAAHRLHPLGQVASVMRGTPRRSDVRARRCAQPQPAEFKYAVSSVTRVSDRVSWATKEYQKAGYRVSYVWKCMIMIREGTGVRFVKGTGVICIYCFLDDNEVDVRAVSHMIGLFVSVLRYDNNRTGYVPS